MESKNNMLKKTITVGIPAYNEEANIVNILNDLLSQDYADFCLEKIIVSSDASTDRTVQFAMSVNDPRILVIDNKERKGKHGGSNLIMATSTSSALVTLDGDTRLVDPKFIYKMVRPILEDGADLTSCALVESKPQTLVEILLAQGNEVKRLAFTKYNDSDNWFSCRGAARAQSNKFYKKFRFKMSVSEDLYIYLYCKFHNFKFTFVRDAECRYSLPSNLKDHLSQNARFFNSTSLFMSEFGTDFVKRNTRWPLKLLTLASIRVFLRNPFYMVLYLLLLGYCFLKVKFLGGSRHSDAWVMSPSAKSVRV